jgi:TetR/AcrR family transcriptional regulator, transcriptional repressor for nem operon
MRVEPWGHRTTKPKYVQDNVLVESKVLFEGYFGAPTREGAMPYPPGHRSEVRKKIVQSARRLFNRHGFDRVSLKQIMAGAGLTHGGFYSYFASKSDLYVEVLGCFFTDPEWKSCWKGVEVDLAAGDAGPQVVKAYLSRQHFEDVENSCPMTALPTDVARGSVSTKRAFETVFRAMVSVLERSATGNGEPRRGHAQAMAALCVGGMVVARAMADRDYADELRDACMNVALELGGWENGRKLKNGHYKSTQRARAAAS